MRGELLSLQGQFSHWYIFFLIYYFILFFPEAADTGSNNSGDFSVIWIAIDHAVEGHVLISHKTPLWGNAFQPLLNWDRFDPRDENSDCNVSPVHPSISEKRMKHSAYGMIYKTKALQLLILNHSNWTTYRQADFFLEQVRWVPTSSSSI